MSLQPDEMASRAGFGPWVVVWRSLTYKLEYKHGN